MAGVGPIGRIRFFLSTFLQLFAGTLHAYVRANNGSDIMLDKIANHLSFFENSLALRAKKVEVISSNIANADTPYYKAVDFDFGKALQGQLNAASNSGMALNTTDGRHIAAQGVGSGEGGLQYRSAVQPSLDGNTVDMDIERAAFTDASIKYQSTLLFLNRRISGLMDAIKGGQ